ncbi:recombinase family protein [Streptomyces hygroscopicus]|uniref:recombinase family protein n=1 Tax=Streptomyces hygroscopicus TaxID=1912 RepID=UPI001F2C6A09|nr:recombinase family protein [Streptomyces hygroscopicus]
MTTGSPRVRSVVNLVYKRVSTDQQSTARQNLVLDVAGIEDPVVFEEDPGTFSRLHPLQRPKFRELLTSVRCGQGYTLRVSAVSAVHRGLLARCQPRDGGHGAPAVPAQRKARREYENRVSTLASAGP